MSAVFQVVSRQSSQSVSRKPVATAQPGAYLLPQDCRCNCWCFPMQALQKLHPVKASQYAYGIFSSKATEDQRGYELPHDHRGSKWKHLNVKQFQSWSSELLCWFSDRELKYQEGTVHFWLTEKFSNMLLSIPCFCLVSFIFSLCPSYNF